MLPIILLRSDGMKYGAIPSPIDNNDYAINQKNVQYKSQEQRIIEQDLIIKELLELLIESGVTLDA